MHRNAEDGADFWQGAEINSGYSREQAIEDGMLVDMRNQPGTPEFDKLAREHGIKWPVAMTATAFFEWINPSDQDARDGQSIVGRMHDLYTLYRAAIRRAPAGADQLSFAMIVWKDGRQQTARFKVICGLGDTPAPVLTFMLPTED